MLACALLVACTALAPAPQVSLPELTSVPGRPGLDVVPGTSAVVGRGPLRRFAVEVERRVAVDGEKFASAVQRTLFDPRGWTGAGRLALQRVDAGLVDFRVTLASPRTVDRLCFPLHTAGFADCFNRERAVINADRWTQGSVSYRGDLRDYRYYLINHEVGHGLGHGHRACPGPGRHSYVMMPQTGTTFGCRRQPWPRAVEQRAALVPPLVIVLRGSGEAAATGANFLRVLGAPNRRLRVRVADGLRSLSVKALKDAGAVVALNTAQELPPPQKVRRELLRFLHEEGGLVAVGSATEGLGRWPEWARMLGIAGPSSVAPAGALVRVSHRSEPATRLLPPSFLSSEPLVLPGGTLKARAVASLGLRGAPVAWCRREGRGHVFADAIGTSAASWAGKEQQALVAGGLAWAIELADGRSCP